MRQICPHCQSAVEVPAESAGGFHECPVCRKPIPVPKPYAPSVDSGAITYSVQQPTPSASSPQPPVPPPGFVAGARPPAPETGEAPASGGVTLSPWLCEWLPVVGLTLIIILTFFAWVIIAPGGYRGYSQSPWGSLFGRFDPDPIVDPVLDAEKLLEKHVSSTWVFLIPYLFGLIALTILAWVDRLYESSQRVAMPSPLVWIEPIWPYRQAALAVGSGILLLLIGLQAAKGFGLETGAAAARASLAAETPGMKEKIDAADTTLKKQRVEIESAKATAYLTTEGTTVRAIALWLQLIVFVAMLGRVWLARRGNKPLPRIDFRW